MKNFLKKHLGLIIYIIVSLVFCLLVSVSAAFLLVGCLMIGCLFIYFGVKVRKRYKEKVAEIEEQEELNYFDARKYDYDEDVYYIGQGPRNTIKTKGIAAKANGMMPSIILFIIGIAFIALSITTVIKMFL